MGKNKAEEYMESKLESFGFTAVKIDETNEKICDYRVSDIKDPHFSCIIEVKDKEDSKHFKQVNEKAQKNGMSFKAYALNRSNTLSGIIEEAAVQLKQTPSDEHEFSIMWLSCLGQDWEYVLEQAFLTLYGLAELQVFDKKYQMMGTKDCFYFNYNDFYKYPHVDAAILVGPKTWKLCLNTFGKRYEKLKQTRFYSLFKDKIDPDELEKQGSAYVMDSAADRKKESEVQDFIYKKYGYRVSRIAMIEARGVVTWKRDQL